MAHGRWTREASDQVDSYANGYPVSIGRNVTAGLLIVSGVICIPLALLASALFAHAPNYAHNPVAFLYPWLLIGGTWGAVWPLWRAGRWTPACILLIILIGIYLYFWFNLELP